MSNLCCTVDLVFKYAEGEGGGPKRHTETRAGAR